MNFVKLVLEEHIYVALTTKYVNDVVRYKQKFEHWNTEGTSLFSVIIIDSKTFLQMWFPILFLRSLDFFISYTI